MVIIKISGTERQRTHDGKTIKAIELVRMHTRETSGEDGFISTGKPTLSLCFVLRLLFSITPLRLTDVALCYFIGGLVTDG